MHGVETINLRAINDYSIFLSNFQIKFKLAQLSSGMTFSKMSEISRWVYLFSGHGKMSDSRRRVTNVVEQDLIYIPPHEEVSILPTAKKISEIIIVEMPDINLKEKKEPVIFSKSKNDVDWVGPWINHLSTTKIHLALTGNDNSSPEKMLHFHQKTIEVYFVARGQTVMMIGDILNKVTLTEGNLLIVRPGVPHGMGLKGETNGVVNYAGLVVKIPIDPVVPVDPRDKFACGNNISYNLALW